MVVDIGLVLIGDSRIVFKQDMETNEISVVESDTDSVAEDVEGKITDWVNALNDPWSDTSVSYRLHALYDSVSCKKPANWQCNRIVNVYDDFQVQLFSYGNTPEEALLDNYAKFKWLSNVYKTNFEDEE